MHRLTLTIALFILGMLLTTPAAKAHGNGDPQELRVMTWNIWHGGREDGKQVGPQRVVDVIRDSGADIVAMQETYGSGEIISDALAFHFQPRGTNVSIHSRYPILEDISVFEEFKCAGALIEVPNQQPIAFYSIWLPYDTEIWEVGTRDSSDIAAMQQACHSSATDLKAIWTAIEQRLSDPKYENVSIVIAGDFNSMSHLDYSAVAREQHGAVVDWQTSHVLMEAGFRDSFRELHPVICRSKDRTWTPRFLDQEQDRIDFIYYRSVDLRADESKVIAEHAQKFPSDHAALLTVFRRIPVSPPVDELDCRVASYNIKHGLGMDKEIDLERIGNVLKNLDADVIGLQEVDHLVARSGKVNQAAELGKQLGMHAAFGSFFDLQGGQYGMGILSRYPIQDVEDIALPEGNEKRIALAVTVRLPSDDLIKLINVHFDWVDDDTFRFAQASVLKNYLEDLDMPYLLLGDFNDQPGSRTLHLFQSLASEAAKPSNDHFTFDSTQPHKEIDFIFYSPEPSWRFGNMKVIDESVASDHRPIVAELRFQTNRSSSKESNNSETASGFEDKR